MLCKDIMKADVECISPQLSVRDAARKMRDRNVGFSAVEPESRWNPISDIRYGQARRVDVGHPDDDILRPLLDDGSHQLDLPDRSGDDTTNSQIDRCAYLRFAQRVGVDGQPLQSHSRRQCRSDFLTSTHVNGHAMISHPLRNRPIPQSRCRERDLGRGKRFAVDLAPPQLLVVLGRRRSSV